MTVSRALVLGAFAVAAVSPACGGGGGGGGGGPSNSLAKSAGDNQIGNAGAALPNPLAVVVRDGANNPVQGTTVSWSVVTGGGSVTASSVTDAAGIATATRTLGSDSVDQTTRASGTGLSGSPQTFTARARIQGATQMQLNGGDAQTAPVGATLPTPYSVVVRNEASVAVAGVVVNWSVTGGGGSVSAAADTTDASGIAAVSRTLGTTAGSQTARARVAGLLGNPVNFTATAAALTASVTVGPGVVFAPNSVTIARTGTVTWNWAGGAGALPHSVRWQTGAPLPSPNSSTQTSGPPYQFTFSTAGTYTYDCAVHGSAMSGTVVAVP